MINGWEIKRRKPFKIFFLLLIIIIIRDETERENDKNTKEFLNFLWKKMKKEKKKKFNLKCCLGYSENTNTWYQTLAWWLECLAMAWETWVQSLGRAIPKTQKMVLDTSLLNTQHYKVRIKGKVEQSRERSSALPYTAV